MMESCVAGEEGDRGMGVYSYMVINVVVDYIVGCSCWCELLITRSYSRFAREGTGSYK